MYNHLECVLFQVFFFLFLIVLVNRTTYCGRQTVNHLSGFVSLGQGVFDVEPVGLAEKAVFGPYKKTPRWSRKSYQGQVGALELGL